MANTQNLDLVKPLGTDHALVSVLNSNSDKIDAYAGAVNAGLDGLRDGLGILADGNTHAAVTSGQFVYVKNHQTLPEGLYQATTNIAANGTLSTSNLAADPKGGLNTLSEQIGTLNGNISIINTYNETDYYAVLMRVNSFVHFHYVRKTECSDGAIVFTIPSGYRPASGIACGMIAHHSDGNAYSRASYDSVSVLTNGTVQVTYSTIAAGAKFSFDLYWNI